MGGCAQVICKYYAILHKGLEHPQILVWKSPGTNPPRILRVSCTLQGVQNPSQVISPQFSSYFAKSGIVESFTYLCFMFILPSTQNTLYLFLHFTNAQTSIKSQVLCHYLLCEDQSFHLSQVSELLCTAMKRYSHSLSLHGT